MHCVYRDSSPEDNLITTNNETSHPSHVDPEHMRHEDDVENVRAILAKHPCTPRPDPPPHRNGDHPRKRTPSNRSKVSTKQSKSKHSKHFKKSNLKPITTPRPDSVGIDSTDDEDSEDADDSNDSELPVPDEEDIAALDDYIIKKKEKWQERQKGPSYHAYTTHDDGTVDEEKEEHPVPPSNSNNKEKPSPSNHNQMASHQMNHKHVRGAEYFPKEELDGRYEFIRYLGHGAYGYVAEGRCLKTGRKVAIKKILRIFHNRIDAKRLLRELKILRVLRGLDSIVQLIDILPPSNFETFNQIILVFEFSDTDLSKLIQSDQYFTKLHVQYMMYQILLGLKFMHSMQIFHRDLKPQNILVNEDVSLKICDFGLARCTWSHHHFTGNGSKRGNLINGINGRGRGGASNAKRGGRSKRSMSTSMIGKYGKYGKYLTSAAAARRGIFHINDPSEFTV